MPTNHSSAAAALSLPTNTSSSQTSSTSPPLASPTRKSQPSSPTSTRSNVNGNGSTRDVPWVRRQPSRGRRRLSTRHRSPRSKSHPWYISLLRTGYTLFTRAYTYFLSLPLIHRVALTILAGILFVIGILGLVYSHKIFAALGPIAKSWRALPGGWVLVWLLCFITAFPPIIGYSSSVTTAGFVFGFPLGWPIAASATVLGSAAAFLASRTVLSGYVNRLVGSDKRFVALGQVLRRDGVVVLAMIRFCPLPYSLSNGFLATIPSIRPWSFALATAAATPKLLVHVFIGSRLALLAEDGDSMSPGDRAINYVSMAVGGLLGMGVGLFIYKRTMARAAELAREDGEEDIANFAGAAEEAGLIGHLDHHSDDDDLEEGARGEEEEEEEDDDDDAAALMDPDDISLWETDGVTGDRDHDFYRDSWDNNETHTQNGK
ncbi:putative tlg2-vesicle protein of 38 kda protein [Diplogelasinospora grovesii]|uniref:Golgi apparatus membrane protein TVP38 n=1 Tax=Diplogelasinospora grovesii TaxID=303347 RepID=A0AAN6S5W0_9PEZI|nr:putative tlg2-vesicle protein of 38 kda protein [Diplogelasinospora grovesii]